MAMPMLKRDWTVDDLLDLPEDGCRYEVVDGELLVTPAPLLRHQRALGALYRRLWSYLEAQRRAQVYFAPVDVIFSPTRGVQPDLVVLPLVDGREPESFEEAGRLLLAVEILSPSTARYDRVIKRGLFRDQGVPEYWIIDLDARTIERSTPAEPRPEVIADRLTWSPDEAGEPFELDLTEYFAAVLGD
jgi:Uma2 family endonuclease